MRVLSGVLMSIFVPPNILPRSCAAFRRQNTKARKFPDCRRAAGRVRFSGLVRLLLAKGYFFQPLSLFRDLERSRPPRRRFQDEPTGIRRVRMLDEPSCCSSTAWRLRNAFLSLRSANSRGVLGRSRRQLRETSQLLAREE